MSLTYNGVVVNDIIYNGTALKQMDYNGVTVFKKDSDKPYLSFIEENGKSFTLKTTDNTKPWDGTMYYSTDGETWSTWAGTSAISSSSDGKLYVRGKNNTRVSYNGSAAKKWVLTSGKRIQCRGNIENLLNYEVVEQGKHPTMASSCYNRMFYGCASLTEAPALPATTLKASCYSSMFRLCTSLTEAPALPAKSLATSCYTYMFESCASLAGQIHLPATVSSNSNRLKNSDITGSSATIVFDL